MTDIVKSTCRPSRGAAPVAIRAELVPLDRVGNYRIDADGSSVKSKYPINRMAKLLFDRGHRGRMETYGPSADGRPTIHRHSCDIERMAARQMTETSRSGIGFIRWTEKALAALDTATNDILFTASGRERSQRRNVPPDAKRRSLRKCCRGEDQSAADASKDTSSTEVAVP